MKMAKCFKGRVIMPDDDASEACKLFVVTFDKPVLVRHFMEQLFPPDSIPTKHELPHFAVEALGENIQVIIRDPERTSEDILICQKEN